MHTDWLTFSQVFAVLFPHRQGIQLLLSPYLPVTPCRSKVAFLCTLLFSHFFMYVFATVELVITIIPMHVCTPLIGFLEYVFLCIVHLEH